MQQNRSYKVTAESASIAVLSFLSLVCAGSMAFAQTAPEVEAPSEPIANSAIDAETFYKILLAELNLLDDEPRIGFALILDSARKNKDAALFDRAITIALQSRSGESALTAARAWQLALPESVDAARYVLQLLLALNRIDQTQAAATAYLELFKTKSAVERTQAFSVVADIFLNTKDKVAAAKSIEALTNGNDYLTNPATKSLVLVTLGRARLAAGDASSALEAAKLAQAADPSSPEPVLLAIALMANKEAAAEQLVKQYLDNRNIQTKPEVRLAYSRVLVSNSRFSEALAQAQQLSVDSPAFAPGWLVLGTLQYQESDDKNNASSDAAQASLKKYIALTDALPAEQRNAGQSRAFTLLAQMAENNKDYDAAKTWLDKIESAENAETALATQIRKASLLAKRGQMNEALALVDDFPESSPEVARAKLNAQVQLLRDNKQFARAYDLLTKAINEEQTKPKPDVLAVADLNYDLAMLAEKMDKLTDMEQLLKEVIAAKPDHHHAYNALGYSLAERGLRLPEAKELIKKAVALAPDDPYIADSLGWVEFKMGNLAEAQRVLENAYKSKPDAEIAAHLGEVLWKQGLKDRATTVWKEGFKLNNSNDTLLETLKRFGVNP
jgi:tetratricopeptide (TPR) repeat protein